MSRRKHISWKTKCAAAVLCLMEQTDNPMYRDAKKMTEDQFLSLFHWDHNMLHETQDENRDKYWNLTPMQIMAHRRKTKADAKIIAKSRRIRAKLYPTHPAGDFGDVVTTNVDRIHKIKSRRIRGKYQTTEMKQALLAIKRANPHVNFSFRKIRSRGFDKTRSRKMDGTVVKREG